MNVKELIGKYEYMSHACFRRVDTLEVLKDLRQLDEPQKVAVPQFVAEVIEGAKEENPELEDLFRYIWFNEIAEEFTEWYGKKSNRDLFARAWLDGYEVEEEKRYLVKLKGIEKEKCYLNYNFGRVWLFYNQENFYGYRAHHTRKELEDAGFGEVFNSTLFEVEEVE